MRLIEKKEIIKILKSLGFKKINDNKSGQQDYSLIFKKNIGEDKCEIFISYNEGYGICITIRQFWRHGKELHIRYIADRYRINSLRQLKFIINNSWRMEKFLKP